MKTTPDDRLRRVAGIIMWRLSKGMLIDQAKADASKRQPELTLAQIQYAADWANAALLYQEMVAQRCGQASIERGPDGRLQVVFPEGKEPDCTPAELREASGLQRFIDEN